MYIIINSIYKFQSRFKKNNKKTYKIKKSFMLVLKERLKYSPRVLLQGKF